MEFIKSGNPIGFTWAFALDTGKKRATEILSGREINAIQAHGTESSIDQGAFGSSTHLHFENGELLREKCKDFGKQLLQQRAKEKGWTPEKLDERALGYGGAAQLIATPYNCPTITLPVLWANGKVNGKHGYHFSVGGFVLRRIFERRIRAAKPMDR